MAYFDSFHADSGKILEYVNIMDFTPKRQINHYASISGLPCDDTSLLMLEEPWLTPSCNVSSLSDARADGSRFPLFARGYENAFDATPRGYPCVTLPSCDPEYIDEKALLNMRCEDEGTGLTGDCACFPPVLSSNEVFPWGFVAMLIPYGE